jgi:hypothetical protein
MIRTGLAAVAISFVIIGSVFYGIAGVLAQTGDHEWPI